MTSIEVARSRKLLSAISPGKKARLSGDKSKTDRARWQAGMGVAYGLGYELDVWSTNNLPRRTAQI